MRISDWSSDVCSSDRIPDSNGAMLAAMLAAERAAVAPPLHARDDRAVIANILRELARHHDVIVTIGGASVGDHDHIRGALADAGGAVDFWRVAMRPGKPLIAGTLGGAGLLGLPGNPPSDERSVGKECVRTCRSRGSPKTKKTSNKHTLI